MEWERIHSAKDLPPEELALLIDAIVEKIGPNIFRREWHDGGIEFQIQSVNPGDPVL